MQKRIEGATKHSATRIVPPTYVDVGDASLFLDGHIPNERVIVYMTKIIQEVKLKAWWEKVLHLKTWWEKVLHIRPQFLQ